MALTLGDNFSYQGAKPLDARLKYDTLAAMKAVADATMYDGCMAYCSANEKTYQWKSTNTVDPDTGKWREFSSGGGGGSTYTAGDGIDITDDTISIDPMPAEDMDDVIDELPTGGNIAVTGYVPLGTLIPYYGETAPDFFLACDGSTYNKADYPELAKHLLSLTNNTPYIVDGDDTKFKVPDLRGEFIRGTGSNSHAGEGNGENVGVHQSATSMLMCWDTGSNLQFRALKNATSETTNMDKSQTVAGTIQTITATTSRADSGSVTHFTSRPTNTSVLFCIAYKDIYSNPMNDYSTDEKVIGTWVDGKTLYQKTITITNFYDNNVERHSVSLGDISGLNVDIAYISNVCLIAEAGAQLIFAGSSYINDGMYFYLSINNKSFIQMITKNMWWDRDDSTKAFTAYITIQYTKTTD